MSRLYERLFAHTVVWVTERLYWSVKCIWLVVVCVGRIKINQFLDIQNTHLKIMTGLSQTPFYHYDYQLRTNKGRCNQRRKYLWGGWRDNVIDHRIPCEESFQTNFIIQIRYRISIIEFLVHETELDGGIDVNG